MMKLCAALALSALAGTAALAKDPQIIVDGTIRIVPGGAAELVVNVEPGDAQLDGGWLDISSVNMPVILSQGIEATGTWLLEFDELKELKIRIPEASSGRSKLLLVLFSGQGRALAAAEVDLIVEPAAVAAHALTTPTVPKAAETTPATAAKAAPVADGARVQTTAKSAGKIARSAAAPPTASSASVASTTPPAGDAPTPANIETPAPKVEPAPILAAAPVTAAPQPAVTPPAAADTAAQPASVTASPSPQPAAPPIVAVVTGSLPITRAEASVELKEQWQRLIGLGQRQLAQGNISYARQYFLRAAETGSATAAFRLAETYDGELLRRLNVIGVKADTDHARHWYQRAAELGADEAADRLQHLKVP